ncbi:MAG: hypothetical protein WBK67_03220 [Minisyncoccales bacterium]|jgi:hypothetical protein
MEKVKDKEKFKIRPSISFGWKVFKRKPFFFIGATLIYLLIPTLIALPIAIYSNSSTGIISNLSKSLAFLVQLIIQVFLTGGFLTIVLKSIREEETSFNDFLGKESFFWPLLWGNLIYSIATMIGSFLLLIPGIIIATRAFLFNFLIIDKNMGPLESIKESFRLTKGCVWKISLFLFIVTPGLILAGALFFFVGSFVTAAVTFLAQAFIYQTLLKREEGSI